MNETPEPLPTEEHHEGGFRPARSRSVDRTPDISRGGPHYGEFIEQVRGLMDRVRLACPSDDVALETITALKELNGLLDTVLVDEWSVPGWVRPDLPANGNITLPPFVVDRSDRDGVSARITFRRFHLGGNSAVHGGYIGLAFDTVLGMSGVAYSGAAIRTASLTVDYRSITPLDTELTIRARVERQEGRKIFLVATLHDGDRLCADARALFLTLLPGQQ
ncbi:PaaI family thioesterase [Nocardia sp. NPDC050630]|uniref:PaaI family thioesterase n=1 Tax=Nocardia sp. NPDC050630 TaxID=3364321 RepID=UPI00379CCBD1